MFAAILNSLIIGVLSFFSFWLARKLKPQPAFQKARNRRRKHQA